MKPMRVSSVFAIPGDGAPHDADGKTMEVKDRSELFVYQLTEAQRRIFAYIMTLLPDPHCANDVLQETNLVLWRKNNEYREGMDFVAWACRVAYFQVLAYRRDRQRDRHLFDEDLLSRMATCADARHDHFEARWQALHECLGKLSPASRDLLLRRYSESGSVRTIAAQLGRPVGSISQALYRIRSVLAQCIRSAMGERGVY